MDNTTNCCPVTLQKHGSLLFKIGFSHRNSALLLQLVYSFRQKQIIKKLSQAFLVPSELYCCLVTIIRNTDNMHVFSFLSKFTCTETRIIYKIKAANF